MGLLNRLNAFDEAVARRVRTALGGEAAIASRRERRIERLRRWRLWAVVAYGGAIGTAIGSAVFVPLMLLSRQVAAPALMIAVTALGFVAVALRWRAGRLSVPVVIVSMLTMAGYVGGQMVFASRIQDALSTGVTLGIVSGSAVVVLFSVWLLGRNRPGEPDA